MRLSVAITLDGRQVDYLSSLITWLRPRIWFLRGRTGKTRRQRLTSAAGSLLFDTFAQLSHRTPPRW